MANIDRRQPKHLSTKNPQAMYQEVFDKLNEASSHTSVVASNLWRVHVHAMSMHISLDACKLEKGMNDLLDILDLIPVASAPSSRYVPTFVGEHFTYTDIPGSGFMYHAKVLCIRGEEIDLIHTGTDLKYGRHTANVRLVEFGPKCSSSMSTQTKKHRNSELNALPSQEQKRHKSL